METATAKQLNFIDKLASERQTWASANLNMESVKSMTVSDASKLISTILSIPKEFVAPVSSGLPFDQIASGSYWTMDGNIARVRKARSSGRLYAQLLNPATNSFDYSKGAIYHLKARMSLEEAKAWGAEHGICCVCAALLSDPKSIAAGIGPVCGKRV